jgi:hypothetical protein
MRPGVRRKISGKIPQRSTHHLKTRRLEPEKIRSRFQVTVLGRPKTQWDCGELADQRDRAAVFG